jgi:hypothetical protein
MAYDKRITDLAAQAAVAAAKNANVAPQLLLADITFTLADAVNDGRITLGRKRFDWERFFNRYIAPVCIACGVVGFALGIMMIANR